MVGILTNGNLYGTIVNVNINNIADPCSLSYEQTIKRTCRPTTIYSNLFRKVQEKNCMIIFKIEKTPISTIEDYSGYFIYHLNTNNRQKNYCAK